MKTVDVFRKIGKQDEEIATIETDKVSLRVCTLRHTVTDGIAD